MKQFTIMLWINKGELRVINLKGDIGAPISEFRYLDEHAFDPPSFDTADEGWAYIRNNYPHLHP